MRHSPNPYKSNRIFANSPIESSREGRDIIEPSVEQSSIFSKNVVQSPASFCQKKPEPMPPTLTRKSRGEVARQESTTQKISHESISRNTKKWSIRTIYLVDSQGDVWSEAPPQNPTWVCKLNLFGDIIDMYNVSPDY
jgi:hypothetical protein